MCGPQVAKLFADATVISILSRASPLGHLYIEDALLRLSINPKTKISELATTQIGLIATTLKETETAAKSGSALVYVDKNGSPIDYALTEVGKYSQFETKQFEDLQSALDFFYSEEHVAHEVVRNPELEKMTISIAKQEHLLANLGVEIDSNKQAGAAIFANMTLVNRIIRYLQDNRRATKEELQ